MQRLIPLINAGLVIVVAYTLAQLTWLIWPAPQAMDKAPVQVTTPPAATAAGSTGAHASLANLHLFGEPQAQGVAVDQAPKVVPHTPLKLTLKGVVASADAKNARAIIADAANKEESYAVNAQLPGDAVLKEIHAEHVVLFHNNQDEILALINDSQPGGAPNDVNATLPAPLSLEGVQQNPEFVEGAPENAGNAAQAPALQPADISATLRNYRDALATNPQSLAGLAQAEPVQENGKFMGYRLQPGSDPMLFSGLGLEAGDIVTAVNGITLDNPARAFEIMQNLTTANQVQVVVNRNGQSKTLAANISE